MAVGIFDSGLGGLTVWDAVHARLPEVPLVYFGDNAHAPYGVRDADDIYDLTTAGVTRLFEAGCDLVILACNTASAAALRRMQSRYASVIGGQNAIVKRVDLGAKGIYYRAMVGPFGSSEEANRVCSELKAAGGSCFIQRN